MKNYLGKIQRPRVEPDKTRNDKQTAIKVQCYVKDIKITASQGIYREDIMKGNCKL